jgi:intergrase/recombinase
MPRFPHKFTAEVRKQVPAWIQAGKSKHDIAQAIGIKVDSLKALCSKYRISLEMNCVRVVLSNKAYRMLEKRAAENGIRFEDLAKNILETVAKDDLFTAVLDVEECQKP